MPAQVGEVVTAHCSQCKENTDVEVVAAVGDEIVTVACKTCGTSQRFRPPLGPGVRPGGRRVVDVGSPEPTPRPRARSSARRVLSSTGREIIDDAPPRRPVPPKTPIPMPTPQPSAAARPTGMGHVKSEDLFRRWDALTTGMLSRHGRPHRQTDSYKPGEIVLHTVHGMGVVEQVAPDGTLTVLFKRGYQALPSTPKVEAAQPKA